VAGLGKSLLFPFPSLDLVASFSGTAKLFNEAFDLRNTGGVRDGGISLYGNPYGDFPCLFRGPVHRPI